MATAAPTPAQLVQQATALRAQGITPKSAAPAAPAAAPKEDPWAAIRRIPGQQVRLPRWDQSKTAPEGYYDQTGVDEQGNPKGLPPLWFPPVLKDDKGNDLYDDGAFSQNFSNAWTDPALQAFKGKFNSTNPHTGVENVQILRLQRPGGHKYDLMDVAYRIDPKTGDMTMLGEPNQFKRQSSKTEFGQGVGATLGPILALAGMPYLSAAIGAMGAGAVSGAAVTAASGGDSSQIAKSAVAGGVTAGASKAAGQYATSLFPDATGALKGAIQGGASAATGGAINAAVTGDSNLSNVLKGSLIGAATGAVGNSDLLSGVDPALKGAVTGGFTSLLRSGGDPKAALMGAVSGASRGNPAARVAVAMMLRQARKG